MKPLHWIIGAAVVAGLFYIYKQSTTFIPNVAPTAPVPVPATGPAVEAKSGRAHF